MAKKTKKSKKTKRARGDRHVVTIKFRSGNRRAIEALNAALEAVLDVVDGEVVGRLNVVTVEPRDVSRRVAEVKRCR